LTSHPGADSWRRQGGKLLLPPIGNSCRFFKSLALKPRTDVIYNFVSDVEPRASNPIE